ncbi:GPO family capsid scaffolding protein [Providencia rettgeri]|uniref:GPO family capsid scaffolding protein n=1 Tax=Providencia rettgeri TaxID=587 RepID=UPI00200A775A|nr:GPO family capsid scaffolding protein [Providencia rettgeri]UPS62251.1 GPO family capsid scaffolding protein [Providencia rettgeri]
MSQLMTNWLCIATEGDTVDGRKIEAAWIEEAAELYDTNLYTACIWPEHERYFGSMGEVLAVKAERDDEGLLRLYAQLCPNHHLLQANRDGQLLFTSAEFTPDGNFRGTGKTYLEGLGVTCSPASVGTTRLRFKSGKNQYRYGSLKPLVIDEVKQFKDKPKMAKEKKGGWKSFFNIDDANDSNSSSTDEVTLENIKEALQEFNTRLTSIESRLDSTETDVEEVQEDIEVVKDVVDTAEFKQLKDNISNIVKNFSKLDSKVTNLPNKNPRGDKSKEKRFNHLV